MPARSSIAQRRRAAGGPGRCARRRAAGAHRSAPAGACRSRWRRSGPCCPSSPRARASCRRRRRRGRAPARRARRPPSSAASWEPSSWISNQPFWKLGSACTDGPRPSGPGWMRRPSGESGVGSAPSGASSARSLSRVVFSVLRCRSSGARAASALPSSTASSPKAATKLRPQPVRNVGLDGGRRVVELAGRERIAFARRSAARARSARPSRGLRAAARSPWRCRTIVPSSVARGRRRRAASGPRRGGAARHRRGLRSRRGRPSRRSDATGPSP